MDLRSRDVHRVAGHDKGRTVSHLTPYLGPEAKLDGLMRPSAARLLVAGLLAGALAGAIPAGALDRETASEADCDGSQVTFLVTGMLKTASGAT